MFFLISQAQGTEWVLFAIDNSGNKCFYDRETLTKLPTGVIKVWEKTAYSRKGVKTKIQNMNSNKLSTYRYETLSHTLKLWEVDCAKRMERVTGFSEHSADGGVLASFTAKLQPSENWQPVTPESIEEALYKTVCPPQKKK